MLEKMGFIYTLQKTFQMLLPLLLSNFAWEYAIVRAQKNVIGIEWDTSAFGVCWWYLSGKCVYIP
jgi:hypothetical protein